MIDQYLIQILLASQIIYLANLIITNFSSMIFIVMALPRVIINYFSEHTGLIKNYVRSQTHLPVSILVPAYNEETTIIKTVEALLKTEFSEYEIIVVNDGSTDGTLEVLKKHFDLYSVATPPYLPIKHKCIRQIYKSHLYGHLVLVDKENGGKADALNAGLNISRYPLFCCIDADSLTSKDAILNSAFHFTLDKRIIAVGGSINIINGSKVDENYNVIPSIPRKMIERIQVIEYTRAFLAGRTFWSAINGMLIVSGAFGIFRKDIVKAIGGYRHTIGEDFDLVIRMRRYCYENKIEHRVLYLPEPMSWTQAPSDYSSLLKQRNRWQRGLIECLYHNRSMIFNPKYGVVGMIALPYYLIVEALNPLIVFIGAISIIILYLADLISENAVTLFFLLEFVWGMALNVFAFWLKIFRRNPYSIPKIFTLLWDSMLEPIYYKPLIKLEQFIATFNFMNSEWGQINRHKIEQSDDSVSCTTTAIEAEKNPS
jgi:cellulose synthase/poly-beta-1,6-N-acetylglucosamine synthase-like glycosyltransferase